MLSYALITFTVGRFIATGLATIFQADFLLMVYAIIAIAFNAYICAGSGKPAVGILITIFFFEAPMYPTLFTLGTANLGVHTRRGAGILVMGVSGGAVFPPIQGAIADAVNTRISYVVPLVGFVYVLGYVVFHWFTHGRHIMRVKDVVTAGLVGGIVENSYLEKDKAVNVEQLETSSKDTSLDRI
jgi:FHS family L-fucose permease-like MFS transporter